MDREAETVARINESYKYHDLGDRKVNCDICHKYTSIYRQHYGGMVIGTLTVCPDCDRKQNQKAGAW